MCVSSVESEGAKWVNKVFKVLITVTNCEHGKQNHICNLSALDFIGVHCTGLATNQ